MSGMNFEEALAQLFSLGQTDEPTEMLATLKKRHGDEWLISEMAQHADDKALDLIRSEIRRHSRSWEREVAAGKFTAPPKGAELWCGWDLGWVLIGEMTEEFVLGRIAYYESTIASFEQLRDEWKQRLELMRQHGARTLADLPEGAEISAVAA